MAERVKRRRLAKSADVSERLALPTETAIPSTQTSDHELSWNGFCEVESEPVSISLEKIYFAFFKH